MRKWVYLGAICGGLYSFYYIVSGNEYSIPQVVLYILIGAIIPCIIIGLTKMLASFKEKKKFWTTYNANLEEAKKFIEKMENSPLIDDIIQEVFAENYPEYYTVNGGSIECFNKNGEKRTLIFKHHGIPDLIRHYLYDGKNDQNDRQLYEEIKRKNSDLLKRNIAIADNEYDKIYILESTIVGEKIAEKIKAKTNISYSFYTLRSDISTWQREYPINKKW